MIFRDGITEKKVQVFTACVLSYMRIITTAGVFLRMAKVLGPHSALYCKATRCPAVIVGLPFLLYPTIPKEKDKGRRTRKRKQSGPELSLPHSATRAPTLRQGLHPRFHLFSCRHGFRGWAGWWGEGAAAPSLWKGCPAFPS